MKSAIVLLLMVIGFGSSGLCQGNESQSICGAKNRPTESSGQKVSFRGKIISDGMHRTIIVPDLCSNEGYGISPGGGSDDPWMVIDQAIMRIGYPGTTDKDIVVDVDATILHLNGKVVLRITRLNRMVLTYPTSSK